MDGMIDAPDEFRSGGGEATCELAARSVQAWRRLPAVMGIVVTHGGPIAALHGCQRGAPAVEWPSLIPPLGSSLLVSRL
jgi:broad specificity phosphatase PhoE